MTSSTSTAGGNLNFDQLKAAQAEADAAKAVAKAEALEGSQTFDIAGRSFKTVDKINLAFQAKLGQFGREANSDDVATFLTGIEMVSKLVHPSERQDFLDFVLDDTGEGEDIGFEDLTSEMSRVLEVIAARPSSR